MSGDAFKDDNVREFRPPWRLRAVNIGDFLAMDIKPREQILDPIIPTQGLCMVHSPRGMGKTYAALGMAYAVSVGGNFLTWEAPRARRVLYVDGEMPAAVMQERLAALVAANGVEPPELGYLKLITPDLQDGSIADLTTEEGQMAIGEHLEDVSLLVLDNISTLCRVGRENEAESWMPVQEWALDLRRQGKSVLFIHHSGKGGQQRGTSKREDVLDTVIALKRPGDYEPSQGARFEVHLEKARGVYGDQAKPFEARLEVTDRKQTWSTKDLEQSLTEQVAALLNEGVIQSEIAELLGRAKGTVSKHAKKAHALGLVNADA